MNRRFVTAVVLLVLLVGIPALPALTKMPPFELDVSVDDGVALIAVRVVGFQGLSSPPEGFDPADLNGLLAVYPSGDLDNRGRPVSHENALAVELKWSGEPGLYEGRVTIETSATWAVVPFPTIVDFDPSSTTHDDYPASLYFDVQTDRTSMLGIAGVILTLLAVGTVTGVRKLRNDSGLQSQAQGSMSISD